VSGGLGTVDRFVHDWANPDRRFPSPSIAASSRVVKMTENDAAIAALAVIRGVVAR
jgi:hypothetical protein